MSKTINPNTEPSVTCGFYNGHENDETPRVYDAIQFGSLFDGLISDGVFATYGDAFIVTKYEETDSTATTVRITDPDNAITVGSGRAWLNHTWTLNDAPLPIQCDSLNNQPSSMGRYDAVVIEVNTETRDNSIKVITGELSDEPVFPELTNTDTIHQYPLCFIHRHWSENDKNFNIRSGDIYSTIGIKWWEIYGNMGLGRTDNDISNIKPCPIVLGALATIDPDKLLIEWTSRLKEFEDDRTAELDAWKYNEWAEFILWRQEQQQAFTDWNEDLTTLAEDWLAGLQEQLSTNQAVNLQSQISEEVIRRILLNGFTDGTKTFSDDGSVITSVWGVYSLVKTFTNNFNTCTTVLAKNEYGLNGVKYTGVVSDLFSCDGVTQTPPSIYSYETYFNIPSECISETNIPTFDADNDGVYDDPLGDGWIGIYNEQGDYVGKMIVNIQYPNWVFDACLLGATSVEDTVTFYLGYPDESGNFPSTIRDVTNSTPIAEYVKETSADGSVISSTTSLFLVETPSEYMLTIEGDLEDIIDLQEYIEQNGIDGIRYTGPLNTLFNIDDLGERVVYDTVFTPPDNCIKPCTDYDYAGYVCVYGSTGNKIGELSYRPNEYPSGIPVDFFNVESESDIVTIYLGYYDSTTGAFPDKIVSYDVAE